jgi:hypothetical protein
LQFPSLYFHSKVGVFTKCPTYPPAYDQTFNVPFSNTTVQNAITTARGFLAGAGAVNFSGHSTE